MDLSNPVPRGHPQFSSVQSLSHVRLFVTPWTVAHQASLSISNSRSLLKLMLIKSAMPSNYPLSSPSPFAFNLSQHQVFSNESILLIKWPKYWNFNFSISPSNEYSGLISFRIDWLDLLAVQGLISVFSITTFKWHPTPVLLPGKSHGWRSLVGCSP